MPMITVYNENFNLNKVNLLLRLNEPGKKTKKNILRHCIYANRKPFSTKWDEDINPDNPNHPSNELYHQVAENDARLKEYCENRCFDTQSSSVSSSGSVLSGDVRCSGIAKAYTGLYQQRKNDSIEDIDQ
ncbi:hypothetical protein Ddc_16025 [Ditylenchus destructor]|nr:hypothetical protein Ddc_16025 [Ditylenchus destructor]